MPGGRSPLLKLCPWVLPLVAGSTPAALQGTLCLSPTRAGAPVDKHSLFSPLPKGFFHLQEEQFWVGRCLTHLNYFTFDPLSSLFA